MDGTPSVFDISLFSSLHQEVQPSGMVTVTLPVPESYLKNPDFQKLLRLYYV